MKEAINNSLKYANAKNITILFLIKDNQFNREIADDGIGFNMDLLEESGIKGNGLVNMRNRMMQHNCSLQIVTSENEGCKIIAQSKLY